MYQSVRNNILSRQLNIQLEMPTPAIMLCLLSFESTLHNLGAVNCQLTALIKLRPGYTVQRCVQHVLLDAVLALMFLKGEIAVI